MTRDNRCMYMAHVRFYVCCTDCVGVCGNVCCVAAVSCPLWPSVYECQRVECASTSPVRTECGMFVMYGMQCCPCQLFCSAWMYCLEKVYKCLQL